LASEPVTEVTEDDPAERPGDEAHGVGDERRDDRVEFVAAVGEEDLGEDEGGGGAVEEELVPLDDGARHGRTDDPAQCRRGALRPIRSCLFDAHGCTLPGRSVTGNTSKHICRVSIRTYASTMTSWKST